MEKLEPLEKLDRDYYLGEHAGWYSDGENRDSESSDDELREKISKLAGVRRCERKRRRGSGREGDEEEDDFESDMDQELDERLVAHASQFMRASTAPGRAGTSKEGLSALGDPMEDEDIPSLEKDSDEEFLLRQERDRKQRNKSEDSLKENTLSEGSASIMKTENAGGTSKKSVTFKEEVAGEGSNKGAKSAFDEEDNLLRRAAVRKANKDKVQEDEVEFYDENEDDDNERWVEEHRRRLGQVSEKKKRANGSSKKEEKDDETDAVLSCPACMTLLSRQCQRHELYRDQYRAMFVENCSVNTGETVFMPESGRKKRKGAKKTGAGPKPNTVVSASDVSSLQRRDLFHPVLCSICSTAVGVYDTDEVYHFFNVLTGYA